MSTALEKFSKYHPIWQKERAETLEEFLSQDPKLNDFQFMILHYRDLEQEINDEPEFYNVGAIALFTGMGVVRLGWGMLNCPGKLH